MGYTRYWKRTEKPITEDFLEEVKKIIVDCAKKGIAIRDWDGTGNPTITLDKITFNGNSKADKDLSHESFFLNNIPTDFDFCKTARKPYDYAVKRILKKAVEYGIVTDVRSDGKNKMCTDEEYILGLVDSKTLYGTLELWGNL